MTYPPSAQGADASIGASMEAVPPADSAPQACPQCEALIDTTESEPLDVVDCPNCGQQFAVTGQISHYQIIEVAGRGGMGVVYKAYDPSLDRYVALKLLKKSQSDDAALIEQLEAEATITASVTDPNVVRVYGTGFDRGRFFLAMELVEQGSLDDLIRLQGRVAEAQVLEVGIQIACGLRAAHTQGLIHRDVKPGNILFADAHTAKIVDFGLAIFMAQEESARGEIWGTPYYVAPEKLEQQPEDFRSDMYSLGGTLFHALAGRPPYEAETGTLVALKHLKSQTVRLQTFAPWASNKTAHIINRTLSKNPDERYQSYDELIESFEFALAELHKTANAPQARTRVVTESAEEDQKLWTWVILGMAAVVVILIAGFFVMRPKTKVTAANVVQPAESKVTKLGSLDTELDALASRGSEAPAKLKKAANDPSFSPTDRGWAQFLEGVGHLAVGDPVEARTAFGRVEPLTVRMKDESLAKFLRETAAQLARSELVRQSDTTSLRRENYETIALLAYGLHDWNLGKFDEGAALLRQFRSAQLNSSTNWLERLKPLATGVIEELTAVDMQTEALKSATNSGDRLAIAEKLREVSPALKSRAEAAIRPYAKEIAEAQLNRQSNLASQSGSSTGQQRSSSSPSAVGTTKNTYGVNEPIRVAFSNGPGNSDDWVGLYKEGSKPGGNTPAIQWFYTNGTQNVSGTTGPTDGAVPFTKGLDKPGNYTVKFLAKNGYLELTEASFTIQEAGRSPSPAPAVVTTKTTYSVNEPISVSFSNGPTADSAWIGLYKAGSKYGLGAPSIKWLRTNGTRSYSGAKGPVSGTLTFSAGLGTPGDYTVRFFAIEGYELLTETPISVR